MGISTKRIITLSIFIVLMVGSISKPISAQVFEIDTVIEGTSSLSLELLSGPDTFEKEQWMNWTVRMTVLEWNPEWNTSHSWDHPSLSVLIRASTVNFTEYHNVSFSLNLDDAGWVSMSIKFIHYLHVFTTYDLGNLSNIVHQDYNVSVKFADDMPTTSYTAELSLYDPSATTTTSTTTTTQTTTTSTSQTTQDTTTTTTADLLYYIPPLAVISIALVGIIALLISKKQGHD